MNLMNVPVRFAFASLLALGAVTPAAPAAAGVVTLAPHLAIYDLKLVSSRGKKALEAVRGRIVYDFSGNACEGYALKFRQVSELDNGEGRIALSDLRTNTWEEAGAKVFRFNSENYMNRQLLETIDGRAERKDEVVSVSLDKPARKTVDIGRVLFPTEHMREIIVAARAGKSLLETAVFDGSENGEKVYHSLTVIGPPIAPETRKPTDAAAGLTSLEGLARWPVTISYFDKAKEGGEQTPVYALTFELYENGVSRALKLDYGDFVVDGVMTTLEIRDPKPCKR